VQHETEDIPHGALLTSPVLEQVPQVAHVDLHSDVGEQLSPESQEVMVVLRVHDATISLTSSVAHVDCMVFLLTWFPPLLIGRSHLFNNL